MKYLSASRKRDSVLGVRILKLYNVSYRKSATSSGHLQTNKKETWVFRVILFFLFTVRGRKRCKGMQRFIILQGTSVICFIFGIRSKHATCQKLHMRKRKELMEWYLYIVFICLSIDSIPKNWFCIL